MALPATALEIAVNVTVVVGIEPSISIPLRRKDAQSRSLDSRWWWGAGDAEQHDHAEHPGKPPVPSKLKTAHQTKSAASG